MRGEMAKKKSKAKLQSVALKLPWMSLSWESDESEIRSLRDLVDQLKSRRAFEINRGLLAEQPVFFIDSVIEMRSEIRKLLSQLPVDAHESRVLMLSVMDWLAEILDEWSKSMAHVNPRHWDFRSFSIHDMQEVLERSWKVVEDVRKRLEKLRKGLEKQLKLERENSRHAK
jgi:vacuolar-type H+-ATPase subunit I/STV1